MTWLKRILSIDSDTTKGRLLLLLIDKGLIALIVGIAFIKYDMYRADDSQRFQRELVAFTDELENERIKIQREFEKARLSKELLPYVLDKDVDVVARSLLLTSALSTELIDGLAALEIAATLISQRGSREPSQENRKFGIA